MSSGVNYAARLHDRKSIRVQRRALLNVSAVVVAKIDHGAVVSGRKHWSARPHTSRVGAAENNKQVRSKSRNGLIRLEPLSNGLGGLALNPRNPFTGFVGWKPGSSVGSICSAASSRQSGLPPSQNVNRAGRREQMNLERCVVGMLPNRLGPIRSSHRQESRGSPLLPLPRAKPGWYRGNALAKCRKTAFCAAAVRRV